MEEKYGEVEEMNVCDNLGDHLVGNVYVKVGLKITSPHTSALLLTLPCIPASFFFVCFLQHLSLTLPQCLVLCSSVMKKTQRRP